MSETAQCSCGRTLTAEDTEKCPACGLDTKALIAAAAVAVGTAAVGGVVYAIKHPDKVARGAKWVPQLAVILRKLIFRS